jgi:streptogramin lyase
MRWFSRRTFVACSLALALVSGAIGSTPSAQGAFDQVTEYAVFPPLVSARDIALGPDGALWFAAGDEGVGRLTTDGRQTAFPDAGRATEITAGPDGNVWYVGGNDRVGRITPAGAVTSFLYQHTANSDLDHIATGSDGNLWLTGEDDDFTGLIVRLTPSGTFTLVDELDVFPDPITAGSDGALWFGFQNRLDFGNPSIGATGIGRITTSGATSLYQLPTTGGDTLEIVNGIAPGPDGNLWFTTSRGVNELGRITTSGVITLFDVPGPGVGQITPGPDGNLWFTTSRSLGRTTTSGVITEFSVPGGTGITRGPDNTVWYASGTKIVRFDLATSVKAGPDKGGLEGGFTLLTGSVGSVSPTTVEWSAGSSPCSFATPAFPTTTVTCNENGVYTLTLTARDGVGAPVSDSMVYTVANVAPSVMAGLDETIDEGGSLVRTGTWSDPGGSDTFTATVDYGDGPQPLSIPPISNTFRLDHAYPDDGNHLITVTITDDDGGVGTATFSETVNNVTPTIVNPFTTGENGTACSGTTNRSGLTFTVTDPADETHDPITGSVAWGDGTTTALVGRSIDLSHAYAAGTYTLNATVDDGDGGSASFTSTQSRLYSTGDFAPPLAPSGSHVFKRGDTIPVKLSVIDCNGKSVAGQTLSVALAKIAPDGTVVVSSVPDGGVIMRYDTRATKYVYNLSTKRSVFASGSDLSAGRYVLTVSSPTVATRSVEFEVR